MSASVVCSRIFAAARHVVKIEVMNQRLAVASMEPRGLTVRYDKAKDLYWKFLAERARVVHDFGPFPRERLNPNGGSTALGHPFGATGARIISMAVKDLAAMPKGQRAIVSQAGPHGGTAGVQQQPPAGFRVLHFQEADRRQ